jgi:hypothetical protein
VLRRMTDYELDLSYRAVTHDLWKWYPGMLGIDLSLDSTLNNSRLEKVRYEEDLDMEGFGPSFRDSLTTHLIWEAIKSFDVPGYSLVRYCSPSVYKGGFKKHQGRSVLLFTSPREGNVAIRMWLWFANKQLTLLKSNL